MENKVRTKAEETNKVRFSRVLLELLKAVTAGVSRAVVSYWLEHH